jgi:hypothetical protein
VAPPLKWLKAVWGTTLEARTRHFNAHTELAKVDITVDASPWGLGGYVAHATTGEIIAVYASAITEADEKRFRAKIGEAAGQTRWEALALLVAIVLWGTLAANHQARLRVRGDNTGALRLAVKLASSDPIMNGIGAELATRLDIFDVDEVIAEHVPGRFNKLADWLSRLWAPGADARAAPPADLTNVRWAKVPRRDEAFFLVWDFSAES